MFSDQDTAKRFFTILTANPKLVVMFSFVVIVLSALGLKNLVKETSVKAFMPAGHPALLADVKATDTFGLSDPIAIAVVSKDRSTIFTPEGLGLIQVLSEEISLLPNVREDRVASLATESAIFAEDGELFVEPYVHDAMNTDDSALSLKLWQSMPPHIGTLVSEDQSASVIMAELVNIETADTTYLAIKDLANRFQSENYEIHIAGPGAISGYLSLYIDQDARKLQPLVFLLIISFIFLAFRKASAIPGPLFVVAGASVSALGLMAWLNIPYYAITNALPVIIVAISVADAIHILSAYYQLQALKPSLEKQQLVIQAMCNMARPITLTTLTTIAGFFGIATVSIMPPITMFAVFAAVGVLMAWLFSIVALPNLMLLFRLPPSKAFANWRNNKPSRSGAMLGKIGGLSVRHHRWVLGAFLVVSVTAFALATQLQIDRSQVDNFAPKEPIRLADELINNTFAGTAFLDVVVETDQPEGLLNAKRMKKIADLQTAFEAMPHVQKTVSIVDYLDRLTQAIEASSSPTRTLPATDKAIAQYLLLYETSGDPTDFEEEIDYGYQTALVRGVLNAHSFSDNRITVQQLTQYLQDHFNEPGMTASLSGNVNVGYHWMESLKASHFQGVLLSLTLVLTASILVFRSVLAGIISVIPVAFTVLILYAVMACFDIYLEPATSMFAAIALGVGVDFAIHLVDRIRSARLDDGVTFEQAIRHTLPPTARACLFNSAALAIGFAVLMVSDLPTLQRFGGLITVAAVSSYLVALIVVPAMFALVHAIGFATEQQRATANAGIGLAVLILLFPETGFTQATNRDADWIAEQVHQRPEARLTRRVINMTMTNKRGAQRQRQILVLKDNNQQEKRTRITYLAPKDLRDTTFLSHDRENGKADARWVFTPATGRLRRLPVSDRGKAFFGTDFSYEDMQSELKFDLADYDFTFVEEISDGAQKRVVISGKPKTPQIAKQLRYGGFVAVVDVNTWMPIRIEFSDVRDRPLKVIDVRRVERLDGIWTATDIEANSFKSGHTTRFRYDTVSYPDGLPENLFDANSLTRGLPPHWLETAP